MSMAADFEKGSTGSNNIEWQDTLELDAAAS